MFAFINKMEYKGLSVNFSLGLTEAKVKRALDKVSDETIDRLRKAQENHGMGFTVEGKSDHAAWFGHSNEGREIGMGICLEPGTATIDEGRLIHELVHLNQWEEGRLVDRVTTTEADGRLTWAYFKDPVEVEAYQAQMAFYAQKSKWVKSPKVQYALHLIGALVMLAAQWVAEKTHPAVPGWIATSAANLTVLLVAKLWMDWYMAMATAIVFNSSIQLLLLLPDLVRGVFKTRTDH